MFGRVEAGAGSEKGGFTVIALKIEDLKTFTAQLFMGRPLIYWAGAEANIVTFNSFTIDGRIRPGILFG